jgi:hypothetical protein
VPILVNLDRSILDRPPDRDDELPTMLHRPDLDAEGAAATGGIPPDAKARPALASDDVS